MKFLILSLSTGEGHNAAARALREALIETGAQAEIYDCFSLVSPALSRFICAAYGIFARRFPRLFGVLYRQCFRRQSESDNRRFPRPIRAFSRRTRRESGSNNAARRPSLVYAASGFRIRRLAAFIRREAPDGILVTHVFAALQLTHLRRRGLLNAWTAGVVTDYDVQPFWNETALDRLFTPCAALSAAYENYGVPRHILAATGIPVTPNLRECDNRREARVANDIDTNRPRVLVAGGSMGAGRIPATVKTLLNSLPENVQIIAVCGNNRRLLRRLRRLHLPESSPRIFGFACPLQRSRLPESRLRVLGFVQPLHALMREADVFISKPGGLSSTEAFALRTPFAAVHPIRGLESNNAAFFRAHDVALCPKTDAELARAVNLLLTDPAAVRQMQSAQRRLVPTSAKNEIARRAVDEVNVYLKSLLV